MPIYEYHCEKCGDFEVTQRITEDALKKCPTCRRKVRKLMSNTSFMLKGSGWYVTDYARKGGGKEDGAAKDDAAGGEAKGEAKPEAKTEAKAEAKPEAKSESKGEAKSADKKASKTAAKSADAA